MKTNEQLKTPEGAKEKISPELEEIYKKTKLLANDKREELIKILVKERYNNLLNKPNMTAQDKKGMQASIDLLVAKNMDTPKNFKRLEAIIYTAKYIEIGGVKRARKDIKAKPKGSEIYHHNGITYFKRSRDMIKQQNRILAQQGMKIPSNDDYEASLGVLPGEYNEREWLNLSDWYVWGNILALITDMSKSGYCNRDDELENKDEIGYRGAIASRGTGEERFFGFDSDNGMLGVSNASTLNPIRPIYK